MKLPKSKSVDIMLVAEGTYPYIRGGVSSWIHQLITGLAEYDFGIIFIGSSEGDYGDTLYDFPANLKHIEVHYLFEDKKHLPKKRNGNKKAFSTLRTFYKEIKKDYPQIPPSMKKISFFTKEVTMEDFLYSKESWYFMQEIYNKNCPDVPFVDFFWTLRNMHAPIWKIASIIENMPKTKLFHAPSTGYAGFLSFLGSHDKDVPFLLTEHGIYTRERKIDMLSAKWIKYHAPALLEDSPKEMNYVKGMWVRFFEKIGHLSYSSADSIISLYPGAKEIQHEYGAPENKTIVIPNGVDMQRLNALVKKRPTPIPKVVTLIGRVVSIKDIKTFIRAIAVAQKTIPEIEGWIVGGMEEEQKYADECVAMVSAFSLQNNISFLGFQQIDDILPKSGLLTLTSISEGMPLVILEGFAAGLPCVSTDVGSCRDLIHGALDEDDIAIGSAGAITSIANSQELAKHYIRFLEDEVLWKSAQENALKRVEKYYQQEQFLEQYRTLYKRMI
ncbi:MAG TPA: DUF3492 domain-containing protein [Sulfurimonas sp.]|nr:DUF3492 domain-containing protein [Sulfurimonas sp.]